MKKIPESPASSKTYKGIQLYRDDVELILSLLQENEFTVPIRDKTFEYDSLDELIKKCGITPTYFEINAKLKSAPSYRASVSLSFEREGLHLQSYGDEQKEPKIVFARIRDILDVKSTRLYKILNPLIWFALITPVYWIYPTKIYYRELSQLPLWFHILSILSIGTFISAALYRRLRHQVILKRKHEGGFLKRNADKIWLLVIGTVFGIILKLIIDAIWKAM